MLQSARACLALFALCACSSKVDALWIAGDVHLGPGHTSLLDGSLRSLRELPGIVNLEGPIAPGAPYARVEGGRIVLRNQREAADVLRRAGVRVASLANNHALDVGVRGRASSQHALSAAGIQAVFGDEHAELELAGRRARIEAFDLSAGVPKDLARELRAATGGGALAIVLFHTSGPPSYLPTRELQHAVELAIAAGARVIAATGSHALARIERRGNALIAWGLGNLAFDCPCSQEDEALILRVQVRADGTLGAEAIPIRAGLSGKPAAQAPQARELITLLNALGGARLQQRGLGAPF